MKLEREIKCEVAVEPFAPILSCVNDYLWECLHRRG